jgi:DNA-binding MarR family transcriptional regulator
MTADAVRRSEENGAPEGFRLSASPAHLLRRAQQYAAGIFQQAGLSDVTLRQSVALAAIAEAEGRSQAELVKATGIDRSTLADMIARMEKKGLVTRVRAAEDGRAKAVSLTWAGRVKLDEALPAMLAVDGALSETLPKSRRAAFGEALAALAEAADDSEFFEVEDGRKAKSKDEKAKRKKKKKKGR